MAACGSSKKASTSATTGGGNSATSTAPSPSGGTNAVTSAKALIGRYSGNPTTVGVTQPTSKKPPTGKKISVDAISIHRMEGGKIAETWEVWDTLGFLQQLGVVPAS